MCSYINTCMLLFKWRFDVAAEQYCVWMLIFVSGQFGRDAQSYCPCQLCLVMIGVWTKQLGYGHTRHFFKRFVTPIGLVWSTPKIGRDLHQPLTHKKSRWRLYLWPFPEGRLISNATFCVFEVSLPTFDHWPLLRRDPWLTLVDQKAKRGFGGTTDPVHWRVILCEGTQFWSKSRWNKDTSWYIYHLRRISPSPSEKNSFLARCQWQISNCLQTWRGVAGGQPNWYKTTNHARDMGVEHWISRPFLERERVKRVWINNASGWFDEMQISCPLGKFDSHMTRLRTSLDNLYAVSLSSDVCNQLDSRQLREVGDISSWAWTPIHSGNHSEVKDPNFIDKAWAIFIAVCCTTDWSSPHTKKWTLRSGQSCWF